MIYLPIEKKSNIFLINLLLKQLYNYTNNSIKHEIAVDSKEREKYWHFKNLHYFKNIHQYVLYRLLKHQ